MAMVKLPFGRSLFEISDLPIDPLDDIRAVPDALNPPAAAPSSSKLEAVLSPLEELDSSPGKVTSSFRSFAPRAKKQTPSKVSVSPFSQPLNIDINRLREEGRRNEHLIAKPLSSRPKASPTKPEIEAQSAEFRRRAQGINPEEAFQSSTPSKGFFGRVNDYLTDTFYNYVTKPTSDPSSTVNQLLGGVRDLTSIPVGASGLPENFSGAVARGVGVPALFTAATLGAGALVEAGIGGVSALQAPNLARVANVARAVQASRFAPAIKGAATGAIVGGGTQAIKEGVEGFKPGSLGRIGKEAGFGAINFAANDLIAAPVFKGGQSLAKEGSKLLGRLASSGAANIATDIARGTSPNLENATANTLALAAADVLGGKFRVRPSDSKLIQSEVLPTVQKPASVAAELSEVPTALAVSLRESTAKLPPELVDSGNTVSSFLTDRLAAINDLKAQAEDVRGVINQAPLDEAKPNLKMQSNSAYSNLVERLKEQSPSLQQRLNEDVTRIGFNDNSMKSVLETRAIERQQDLPPGSLMSEELSAKFNQLSPEIRDFIDANDINHSFDADKGRVSGLKEGERRRAIQLKAKELPPEELKANKETLQDKLLEDFLKGDVEDSLTTNSARREDFEKAGVATINKSNVRKVLAETPIIKDVIDLKAFKADPSKELKRIKRLISVGSEDTSSGVTGFVKRFTEPTPEKLQQLAEAEKSLVETKKDYSRFLRQTLTKLQANPIEDAAVFAQKSAKLLFDTTKVFYNKIRTGNYDIKKFTEETAPKLKALGLADAETKSALFNIASRIKRGESIESIQSYLSKKYKVAEPLLLEDAVTQESLPTPLTQAAQEKLQESPSATPGDIFEPLSASERKQFLSLRKKDFNSLDKAQRELVERGKAIDRQVAQRKENRDFSREQILKRLIERGEELNPSAKKFLVERGRLKATAVKKEARKVLEAERLNQPLEPLTSSGEGAAPVDLSKPKKEADIKRKFQELKRDLNQIEKIKLREGPKSVGVEFFNKIVPSDKIFSSKKLTENQRVTAPDRIRDIRGRIKKPIATSGELSQRIGDIEYLLTLQPDSIKGREMARKALNETLQQSKGKYDPDLFGNVAQRDVSKSLKDRGRVANLFGLLATVIKSNELTVRTLKDFSSTVGSQVLDESGRLLASWADDLIAKRTGVKLGRTIAQGDFSSIKKSFFTAFEPVSAAIKQGSFGEALSAYKDAYERYSESGIRVSAKDRLELDEFTTGNKLVDSVINFPFQARAQADGFSFRYAFQRSLDTQVYLRHSGDTEGIRRSMEVVRNYIDNNLLISRYEKGQLTSEQVANQFKFMTPEQRLEAETFSYKAAADASLATFTNKNFVSDIVSEVKRKINQKSPGVGFLVESQIPFLKAGANSLIKLSNRILSPVRLAQAGVSVARGSLKARKLVIDRPQQEMIFRAIQDSPGAGLFLLGTVLAAKGMFNPVFTYGEKDKRSTEFGLVDKTVNRLPGSIKAGNFSIQVSNQDWGLPITLGAMIELSRQGKLDNLDKSQLASVADILTDTFIRNHPLAEGSANLVNMVKGGDIGTGLAEYASELPAQLIPDYTQLGYGIGAQIAGKRSLERAPSNLKTSGRPLNLKDFLTATKEAVQAKIPVLRESLAPKVDLLGRTIEDKSLLKLAPIDVRQMKPNALVGYLDKLGIGAPAPRYPEGNARTAKMIAFDRIAKGEDLANIYPDFISDLEVRGLSRPEQKIAFNKFLTALRRGSLTEDNLGSKLPDIVTRSQEQYLRDILKRKGIEALE